jgi:hypothetical protein
MKLIENKDLENEIADYLISQRWNDSDNFRKYVKLLIKDLIIGLDRSPDSKDNWLFFDSFVIKPSESNECKSIILKYQRDNKIDSIL